MLLLLSLPALAGSGPWTLSEGDASVYAGAEYQRFSKLVNSTGSYGDPAIDVDAGIERTSGQLIVGYGVRERIDLELDLPYSRVEANRSDGALCEAVGLDACKTTSGFGVLSLRGKGLLVDELAGAPLSLSIGPELRFGQLTASTRERITNLGEGTTDVGLNVAIGRSGALGSGFWSGYVDVIGRYRFPNVDGIPGSELQSDGEVLMGGANWSIGPAYSLLYRPNGVDVETVDFADEDRFGSLSVTNVRVGGKFILRSDQRVSLSVSAFGTAYAVNNPSDVLLVSAGLSFTGPVWKQEDP